MKNSDIKTESLLKEAARISAERETERLAKALENNPAARNISDEMFLHGKKKALKSISRGFFQSAGQRIKLVTGIAAAVTLLISSMLIGLNGSGRMPTVASRPISTLPVMTENAEFFGATETPPIQTAETTEAPSTAPTGTPTILPTETATYSPEPTVTPEMPRSVVPESWEGSHYFSESPDAGEPKVSYMTNDEIVYAQIARYESCSLMEYFSETTIQPAFASEYVKVGESKVALMWAQGESFCLCWDDGGKTLLLEAGNKETLLSLAKGITTIDNITEE
ncbi:MAG: hypothetical protein PHI27_03135 [Eubacteriales bacterium]|nr:hypothetical protein [Eubacteriales bacterium]MDD3881230.1 hypothetical protein [Eubacteriales bacterium]MDD4512148.1 hypothetical protein [Eubacteriales bacterium]